MRLTQDKTLKRNLKLLHACSKIEEIRLKALAVLRCQDYR